MDYVFVNDLKIQTVIGVFEFERVITQTLIIDLEMSVDAKYAAETDELSRTIDYTAVSNRLREYASEQKFQLIETLAQRFSEIIFAEFSSVKKLKLKLRKPGIIPYIKEVGIVIERERK